MAAGRGLAASKESRFALGERKVISVYEAERKLLRTSATLPMTMSPRAAEYLACNWFSANT